MLTDFHGNEAKKKFCDFFFFQNCRLKKTEIFKTVNSKKEFAKISEIGSWVVGLIDTKRIDMDQSIWS